MAGDLVPHYQRVLKTESKDIVEKEILEILDIFKPTWKENIIQLEVCNYTISDLLLFLDLCIK